MNADVIRRVRKWPRPFLIALVLSLGLALGVGTVAWTWTDYESSDHLQFGARDPNRWIWTFVFHLETSGPLTTHKDVAITRVQVLLGFSQTNISRITVLLRSEAAGWVVNVTREVSYAASEEVNEFWTGALANEPFRFNKPGIQNV